MTEAEIALLTEVRRLEGRLRELDRRLDEIECLIKQLQRGGTY